MHKAAFCPASIRQTNQSDKPFSVSPTPAQGALVAESKSIDAAVLLHATAATEPTMTILVTVLLMLVFGLVPVMSLLRVLQDLVERNPQDSPIFHDPGPIFHDQVADHRDTRSQFAWQSRSHSRGPD
jgi:hypothetical protein